MSSHTAAGSSTFLPPIGSIRCGLSYLAMKSSPSGSSKLPVKRAWNGSTRIEITGVVGGGHGETASGMPSPRDFVAAPPRVQERGSCSRSPLPAPGSLLPAPSSHLADYLPPQSWFLLIEPGELESEGRRFLERLNQPQGLHYVADVIRRAVQFPSVTASAIATGSVGNRLPAADRIGGTLQRPHRKGPPELDDAGRGQQVFLICQTEAEVRRLQEVFGAQLARDGRLHFSLGTLQNGFRLVRPDRAAE